MSVESAIQAEAVAQRADMLLGHVRTSVVGLSKQSIHLRTCGVAAPCASARCAVSIPAQAQDVLGVGLGGPKVTSLLHKYCACSIANCMFRLIADMYAQNSAPGNQRCSTASAILVLAVPMLWRRADHRCKACLYTYPDSQLLPYATSAL